MFKVKNDLIWRYFGYCVEYTNKNNLGCNLLHSKIIDLDNKSTSENFCIILSVTGEEDFFIFPWDECQKTIFSEEFLIPSINGERFYIFSIHRSLNNKFILTHQTKENRSFDISDYYCNWDKMKKDLESIEDTFIEHPVEDKILIDI